MFTQGWMLSIIDFTHTHTDIILVWYFREWARERQTTRSVEIDAADSWRSNSNPFISLMSLTPCHRIRQMPYWKKRGERHRINLQPVEFFSTTICGVCTCICKHITIMELDTDLVVVSLFNIIIIISTDPLLKRLNPVMICAINKYTTALRGVWWLTEQDPVRELNLWNGPLIIAGPRLRRP